MAYRSLAIHTYQWPEAVTAPQRRALVAATAIVATLPGSASFGGWRA
jgi:hypothetical protein